jgi:hypothetical protein
VWSREVCCACVKCARVRLTSGAMEALSLTRSRAHRKDSVVPHVSCKQPRVLGHMFAMSQIYNSRQRERVAVSQIHDARQPGGSRV